MIEETCTPLITLFASMFLATFAYYAVKYQRFLKDQDYQRANYFKNMKSDGQDGV
jgi:hypothetical protein